MAETATAATPFPMSMEAFFRLGNRQKLISMIGIALLLAVLIGGLLWAREPSYAVLFSIQDEKDGGQIVAALQQQNIPYHFSEGGHTILVPQAVVHDTRLRLAAQGLPKGGLVGFELLENQKMGISQFAEQVNYQRGLEGELARSIQSLAAVKGARVHLAIPKQSAFLRDDQKTSASVLVSLYPGRKLEPGQVAGIVNLVASSVPQLNPANVSVIDQEGSLVSQQKDPSRDAGLDPLQIKYVRDIEASYVKRIESILAPIVGVSNVRAQVAADVDFSLTDQVAETYKPNPSPATAIRSQQIAEAANSSPPAAGIPGALSNQPPATATAPIAQAPAPGPAAGTGQNYSKNATFNYEVDKTILHTKAAPGSIRRLSVAVVVNFKKDLTKEKDPAKAPPQPLAEADLKLINELAREAMGFTKERGDTLNVANAPFTVIEKDIVPDAPFWANAELMAILKDLGKYLLIAGGVFWLWTRVLKPILEKLMEAAPVAPSGYAGTGGEGMPHMGQPTYESKLAAARELAKQDPKAVANMIKDWVGGGGH
ncbi:MAG: flagellar basal-body MS-ring/collar protein FliF [Rhodocyclales bacterium]|nr:flagellar basal-body MS-ring/collar protein FliF [Rhodocyclales bacterium]